MKLQIDNHIITTPIKDIIFKIRELTNCKYFSKIIDRVDYLSVTCPYHAEGKESHPSCSIYTNMNNEDIIAGTFHCFTCGTKGSLLTLVMHCLEMTEKEAKEWLVDNYSDVFVEYREFLPEITNNAPIKNYLDESILEQYNFYHPYMDYRKISADVRKQFKIGYDSENNMITFPVWDDKGNLLFISKRSVKGKRFELAAGQDKPIYGLNFIKQKGITTVNVVESQINCLTSWSWGYPAVALFGTGSKTQYEILKKSGIRNYCLCFDGDMAGDHGRQRFIAAMPKDVLISYKQIPKGKDVNDLTKEEFDNLQLFWK